jgi:hypothetical protein
LCGAWTMRHKCHPVKEEDLCQGLPCSPKSLQSFQHPKGILEDMNLAMESKHCCKLDWASLSFCSWCCSREQIQWQWRGRDGHFRSTGLRGFCWSNSNKPRRRPTLLPCSFRTSYGMQFKLQLWLQQWGQGCLGIA